MKKISLLFFVFSFVSFAQEINNYQYVVVPKKFDDFKYENSNGLNTNVKLMLRKYGFKAYSPDELISEQINLNRCEFLTADLSDVSNLMVTKVRVVLKDCNEKIIFQTEIGTSREKEHVVGYNQALRAAAKSFETLNYKYVGKTTASQATVEKPVVKVIDDKIESKSTPSSAVFFFAQPTANGYQVVDSEPKVIMRLYNTSQKNVFMADKNGVNGTVLLKDGQWVFEYYNNGNLISEPINLKF
jgi:hypothetical protein